MGFTSTEKDDVVTWLGDPDCQTGHGFILERLIAASATFLKDSSEFSNNVAGNLGEFTALQLGLLASFGEYRCFTANAHSMVGRNSRSELDIVWLLFHERPSNDLAVLQEIKTTGSEALSYANNLIKDYDKLFGEDPHFTLQSRLDGIKNEIELKLKRPDLCPRVTRLAGASPKTSPQVHLLPTLFCDRDCKEDSRRKMIAIRSTLIGKGWPPASVKSWAIGLSDLNDRLLRLALGKP
jgi:hypothetical protein